MKTRVFYFLNLIIFGHFAEALRPRGRPVYLDKELFDLIEKGETLKAADLLKGSCVNDITCTTIPDDGYDHFEIYDFVKQPTPQFVRPKVNMINSIERMAPSTVIHMDSPTASRVLRTHGIYRNSKLGMIDFKYQLSPKTWLASCITRIADGSSKCTNVLGDVDKSSSGGEILTIKKTGEDFRIQFQFGCKAKNCLLVLRQVKLYDIENVMGSGLIQQTAKHTMSDKAVEIVSAGNDMSPYTWVDRGFQGRDLSHLIENAIQQEQDELDMINNPPPSEPPRRPPPRRHTTTTSTTTTTTTTTTTAKTTTCRPRPTTTTEKPESSEEIDDDYDLTLKDKIKSALTTGGVAAVATLGIPLLIIGAQLFMYLTGVSAAEKLIQELVDENEEQKREAQEWAVANDIMAGLRDIYSSVSDIAPGTTVIMESLCAPLALFTARIVVSINRKDYSLWHETVLRTKIHEQSVEESSSLYRNDYDTQLREMSDFEKQGMVVTIPGREVHYEKVFNIFRQNLGSSPIGSFEKPDDGPYWTIEFVDNFPLLAATIPENWFRINVDEGENKMTQQKTHVLTSGTSSPAIHGTVLTHIKPESNIRSFYYQCPSFASVQIQYKFFAQWPHALVDLCMQFAYSTNQFCAPLRNSSFCSQPRTYCVADFTEHYNNHPLRGKQPFQMIVKIKTSEPIRDGSFKPALLGVKWYFVNGHNNQQDCVMKTTNNKPGDRNSTLECTKFPLSMVGSQSVALPIAYEKTDDNPSYSSHGVFDMHGDWYKSTCKLNFANGLQAYNNPFTSLSSQGTAITVHVIPNDDSYLVSQELDCTSTKTTIKFFMSSTSPHLYLYLCLYRTVGSVSYECSHGFHSKASQYPNFHFESDSPTDTIEFFAKTRDDSTSGYVTVIFDQIEIVC